MSFSGKLGDVRLHDLLLMIASRRRSGRLTLRREGAEGVILFRGGKILAAVSTADPQTIGSLLLTEGHITEQDLYRALELQRKGAGDERLTGVLERTEVVPQRVLEEVVRRKVASVIEYLLGWTTGYFHFVQAPIAGQGEVEIDAGQFVERPGLGRFGDHLLTPEAADESPDQPESPTENPAGVVRGAAASIATLAPLPAVTGEVTLRILEAAKTELECGVLFVVRHDAFRAVSRFGARPEVARPDPAGSDAHELRIPLEEPSVLRDAVERGEAVRGEPEETQWNRTLRWRADARCWCCTENSRPVGARSASSRGSNVSCSRSAWRSSAAWRSDGASSSNRCRRSSPGGPWTAGKRARRGPIWPASWTG